MQGGFRRFCAMSIRMAFVAASVSIVEVSPAFAQTEARYAQFSTRDAARAIENLQRNLRRQQRRQQLQVLDRQGELAADRATIREAQEQLNALGYDAGPADGLIGPRTRQALRDFQSSVGLPPSGVLDADTLQALAHIFEVRTATQRPVPGASPAAGTASASPYDGAYAATSRTASAVTGDIVVAAGRITFANGASIGLRPAEADRPGVFAIDPPANPVLFHGTRLCGEDAPRYVVLAQSNPNTLYLKVFDGPNVPAPSTSALPQPGMCASYNFEHKSTFAARETRIVQSAERRIVAPRRADSLAGTPPPVAQPEEIVREIYATLGLAPAEERQLMARMLAVGIR
jgi:tellurite resistance protein